MSKFEFKYRSTADSEDKMYNDLSEILIDMDLAPRLKYHIMLSISEAFTNALIHGNRKDPDKYIHLHISVKNNEITADIIDEGGGLPNDFDRKSSVGLLAEGGRGIKIMESMCGNIKFGKNPETGGLQVSLIFDLSGYVVTGKKINS